MLLNALKRRGYDVTVRHEPQDKLLHVLFSSLPDDLGLYGKPMARNCQLWTHDSRLLLDGPRATPAEIEHALLVQYLYASFSVKPRYQAVIGTGVGFQKSVTHAEQQLYAARSYSLIKPPRIGRHLIRS